VSPRCVRCGVIREDHADIAPADAIEGICPRFDPPAPRWMAAATRVLEKLIERQP
jgi:hypothetical protein